MSWHGGTEVAETMIDLCAEFVPPIHHKPFLTRMFQVLETQGWDTPHSLAMGNIDVPEQMNKIVKETLVEMNQTWYEFEDDGEDLSDDEMLSIHGVGYHDA